MAQFTAGTVDFGATDSAMTDEEVTAAKKKGDPVHVPTVFGSVTVSYNLERPEERPEAGRHDGADIFLGKVKKWNDPAIAKLNSGAKLPGQNITVCHRSDESGTTKLFTTFLADYSPEWKNGPGVDKTVKWPTGTGAKGNDGVAGCVKQNKGGVGYVEQAYALQNKFTTADVKNKAGTYIAPSSGLDLGRRRGHQGPGGPALRRDQLAGREGLPDRLGHVPAGLQGHVQGGACPRPEGQAGQGVAGLRHRRRPEGGAGDPVRPAAHRPC